MMIDDIIPTALCQFGLSYTPDRNPALAEGSWAEGLQTWWPSRLRLCANAPRPRPRRTNPRLSGFDRLFREVRSQGHRLGWQAWRRANPTARMAADGAGDTGCCVERPHRIAASNDPDHVGDQP